MDPAAGTVEAETIQAQRRGSMLDENRRDTLIASESSLLTDSIIRGELPAVLMLFFMPRDMIAEVLIRKAY